MKPILYSYFRSSSAYRVRIALNWKSIPYEYRPVSLINQGGEQYSAEFKKLNPMGQVPVFIHKNITLTQSMAILNYLDETFSENPLFPKDPIKKSRVIELCEIINSGIQPIQNLSVLKKIEQEFNAGAEQKKKWAQSVIADGLKGLEGQIEKAAGRYAFGDEVTAVDCFLVPQLFNARRYDVDLSPYPNVLRADENARSLLAFSEAAPEAQPDFKE